MPEEPTRHHADSRATLYALSVDPDLLESVRAASKNRFRLIETDSMGLVSRDISEGREAIVLVDSEALTVAVESFVTKLNCYAKPPVILVAAEPQIAERLSSRLVQYRIHELATKPIETSELAVLFDSAEIEFRGGLGDRDPQQQRFSSTRTTDTPTIESATADKPPLAWSRFALGLLAALVGAFVIYQLGARSRPDHQAKAPPPVPTRAVVETKAPAPEPPRPAEDSRVATLLEAADEALAEGRLTRPADDNAILHYGTALGLAPGNTRAKLGLAEAKQKVFAEAERSLVAEDFDTTEAVLTDIRAVDPDNERLKFFEAQLSKAREAAALKAEAEQAEARNAKVEAELEEAKKKQAEAEKQHAEAARQEAEAEKNEAEAKAEAERDAAAKESSETAPTDNSAELEAALKAARDRIRRGSYLFPTGDGAVAFLAKAESLASGDDRVEDLRSDMQSAYVAVIRSNIAASKFDKSVSMLDQASRLGISRSEVGSLRADIESARANAETGENNRLLALALSRIESGKLTQPTGDSAVYYLSKVRSNAPNHPGLRAAVNQLTSRLADSARHSVAARDYDAAAGTMAMLADLGADSDVVRGLAGDIAFERRQSELLGSPAALSEFRVVERFAPEYPPKALERSIEGWVDLQFVVDVDGSTRDLKILEAKPPQVFDKSVIEAFSRARFQPYRVDGRAYRRVVKTRVTFKR